MKKIIFLSIILSFVLSGCFHKPAVKVDGGNESDKVVNEQDEKTANSKQTTGDITDEQQKADDEVKGQNNQEDETANWQTYRDEEIGIEFKYPEGWKVEKKEKIKLGNPVDYIRIINLENNSNLSIERDRSQGAPFNDTTFQKIEDIYIDGHKTYLSYLEESIGLYYKYFVENNYKESYFIYFVPFDDEKNIFYKIISTFKFIN